MTQKPGRLSACERVLYFRSLPAFIGLSARQHAEELMRCLPAVVVGCLLILTIGSTSAADWPQWRGPNRDGISPEKGLLKTWPKDGPNLAWQANLGGAGYG